MKRKLTLFELKDELSLTIKQIKDLLNKCMLDTCFIEELKIIENNSTRDLRVVENEIYNINTNEKTMVTKKIADKLGISKEKVLTLEGSATRKLKISRKLRNYFKGDKGYTS